jgi:hypothetical protein
LSANLASRGRGGMVDAATTGVAAAIPAAAAVVVVARHNSSNIATFRTAPTTTNLMNDDQPVKCVTKKVTRPLSAGTGLMNFMVQITKCRHNLWCRYELVYGFWRFGS